jgi:hypothetical protein
MSRGDDLRARLEGVGETAMAAQEDVESMLRQLGAPSTRPGKWVLRDRYFTSVRASTALILFECEATFEWHFDDADEAEEPF